MRIDHIALLKSQKLQNTLGPYRAFSENRTELPQKSKKKKKKKKKKKRAQGHRTCMIYRINLKSIFKWNFVKLFTHLAPTKLFQRIEQMIFLKREKKRTQGRGCEWYIYNQSEIHLLLKFSKVLSIYNYLCSQPIQPAVLYVKCQKDLLIIMNVMGKQDSVRFRLRTDFRPMPYIDALYCFPPPPPPMADDLWPKWNPSMC